MIRFGAGERGKFYHIVKERRGPYGATRWLDCNSWERKPLNKPPVGKLPCPKCFKAGVSQ